MYKFYLQYNNYIRAIEEWDSFCRALKDCWRRIPGALICSLIMSMPRRLYACRRARGWQTKYRPCAHHWLKKSINLLIFWLSYDALKLWWMMLKFALRATGVQNFWPGTVATWPALTQTYYYISFKLRRATMYSCLHKECKIPCASATPSSPASKSPPLSPPQEKTYTLAVGDGGREEARERLHLSHSIAMTTSMTNWISRLI
jgi:hypothetical protein